MTRSASAVNVPPPTASLFGDAGGYGDPVGVKKKNEDDDVDGDVGCGVPGGTQKPITVKTGLLRRQARVFQARGYACRILFAETKERVMTLGSITRRLLELNPLA